MSQVVSRVPEPGPGSGGAPPLPRPLARAAARLISAYVGFAARRTRALLVVFLMIVIAAAAVASKLELHTDMAELLPDGHPSVEALRRISGRQKSATNLVLMIESPDPLANQRFAEALRPRLQAMIPEVFTEIQWRPDTEIPDYAGRWRWLYAERAELEQAETLLDRIIARRKSPLIVDLDGDPEAELRDLRKQLDQRLPPRSEAPYFSGSDGKGLHTLGIMMWRRRDGFGSIGDIQTLESVQRVVNAAGPATFHPQLRPRYTGHIAMAVDQQRAIREDLTWATAICVSLVLLSIYLYFRRIGLLFAIGTPAFFGLLVALALARHSLHSLNINTAFLISIILGNGINTPIILLARYAGARRAGQPTAQALASAMMETLLGTSTAMLAASVAYGSLIMTDFRGFSQFGLLGGVGMLLVWGATFLLVPPLVLLGERLRPGLLTPGRNLWRLPFVGYSWAAVRVPGVLALCGVLLCGVAIRPLLRQIKDPLEWDMTRLGSDETESERLWGRMESMGMGNVGAGYIGNNGVLLVDRPEQADEVAEALRRKDKARGADFILKEVRTINSMLPKDQDEKLALLARVRGKIDRHRELMDEAEWKDLQPFRPPEYLRRLTTADLPRQVREAFTEIDGQVGRLIGIDVDPAHYQDWNGHDLLRLSPSLQVDALGKTWIAASASTIFAGMLETLYKDGRPVTTAALIGVTLLVLVTFGLRGAVPVLLSIAFGVIWLGGLMGHFGLKLNFMNFVALPITLGVGADYAANLWARLRGARLDEIREVMIETGSAVALCSATTIIGYSSLLKASNRALRSFGLLADLGEVTCLLAALLVLPFLAAMVAKWRGNRAMS